MPGELLIHRATVVMADRVVPAADVRVVRGMIVAAEPKGLLPMTDEPVIGADGLYLLPGLVDLHCDAVEKEVQPRPGVRLPLEIAFAEMDRKLALAGVTTMYHGVSFGAGEGIRSNETAIGLVRALARFAAGPTIVRHRVHLRFEMSNCSALDPVAELIEDGCVHLLSFMDHTPGQGQYRDVELFRQYVRKTYWVGDDQVERIINQKLAGRRQVSDQQLAGLASLAQAKGITIAGHDPDSRESVEFFAGRLGATILEFPMCLDVARYATGLGLHVCVGAPNLLIGGSHDGNLSAREAVTEGAADLLCSDYYPAGLLKAALGSNGADTPGLPVTVGMATRYPARAADPRSHYGAVQPGMDADLILVRLEEGMPTVVATIVDGRVVLAAGELVRGIQLDQRSSVALAGG